jgi:hypothetical protein
MEEDIEEEELVPPRAEEEELLGAPMTSQDGLQAELLRTPASTHVLAALAHWFSLYLATPSFFLSSFFRFDVLV